MFRLPPSVTKLIAAFQRLPGIGPKTAQRLTFYLLHVPEGEIERFVSALKGIKEKTRLCTQCFSVTDTEVCPICTSSARDKSKLLVVEEPIDVYHFERTGKYNGLYHVLHGRIDPLNNLGPEDIYLPQLIRRVARKGDGLQEIILATSPDMEGEATAMYITKKIKIKNAKLKITRLAHGLPVGASVEFADTLTLARALEGRREF